MNTPQTPSIDSELKTLAEAQGLSISHFLLGGERLYFVRRGETLLHDGQSMTRRKLGAFLRGEVQA